MNPAQKTIIVSATLIMIGMLLYPPFFVTFSSGMVRNMGYQFLLNPPMFNGSTASVNIPLLLTQTFIIALCASSCFFLTARANNNKNQPLQNQNTQAQPGLDSGSRELDRNRGYAKQKGGAFLFFMLRLARGVFGIVFVSQLFAFLPMLLTDLSSINGDMIGRALVNVVIATIFGLLFFGLRYLINKIHGWMFGSPHPILQEHWAL